MTYKHNYDFKVKTCSQIDNSSYAEGDECLV